MAGQRAGVAVEPHDRARRCRSPAGRTAACPCVSSALGAAQDRPQPRQQLARLERLGQIVVGAEFEPDDAVHGVAARGQHQDRRRRPRADAAADLEPVHVGQHQVEDDGIERLARLTARCRPRRVPAMRHAKARLAEIVLHHLGEARVVFDQQDAVGHHGIVAGFGWIAALPPLDPLHGRRGIQKPATRFWIPASAGMSGGLERGHASAAMPARACSPRQRVDPLGDLPALLRRQHAGGVGDRLREAAARLVGKRHLVGAQRFRSRRGRWWSASATRGRAGASSRLLTHRQQIPHRRADDAAQPLLLLGVASTSIAR